eukprot:CAMPEP_0201498042 /NCGR_PEP_ID=MMETSP0151_2-20130828/69063_1 /ASSEMBLY_ACC=CAM_ASM_000257 /TAXON_ID=200890 /ORGANISM="Paramoeba atlantica, Strain 621/1 / CCAP 1560/9" /LENGTH=117 /DNA_ID=CAMNT_0047889297 /DNA_START=64 /DNA_END=413 /DNA_ORIENTATION=+
MSERTAKMVIETKLLEVMKKILSDPVSYECGGGWQGWSATQVPKGEKKRKEVVYCNFEFGVVTNCLIIYLNLERLGLLEKAPERVFELAGYRAKDLKEEGNKHISENPHSAADAYIG